MVQAQETSCAVTAAVREFGESQSLELSKSGPFEQVERFRRPNLLERENWAIDFC